MPRLQETIAVNRSVSDCFRYVVDFSTIEQWDPGVYRASKITPAPVDVGTRFEVIINSGGQRQSMTYELLEIDAPHRVVLRGEGARLQAMDEISFRRIDEDSTEITYIADLDFEGLLGAAAGLLRPWLDRIGRHAVQGLQDALQPPKSIPTPTTWDRLKRLAVLPAAWEFTERGYLNQPHKGLSEFIDDQTAVITGPTSGLGLAAASELARLGAKLVLVGRTPHRLDAAVKKIRDFSGCPPEKIDVVEADLSTTSQVRQAAEQIQARTEQVDILINNAGALFDERGETEEGHERCLAINLLAPFVLTDSLLQADRLDGGGRVINISSGGMYTQPLDLDNLQSRRGDYDGARAYARAKRGLVALTHHWADEFPPDRVTFNAMHPGWADTPGVASSLPRFYQTLKGKLRDPRMGADTAVWLASASAVEGVTGQFFFDRKPRPTAIFPGTEVSQDERRKLVNWLTQVT